MSEKEIDVAKPFTFKPEDGSAPIKFRAGRQSVAADVADHWYVQAHCVGAKPKFKPGTPAHLRAEAEARAELETEAAKVKDAHEAEVEKRVREKLEAEHADRMKIAIEQQAQALTSGVDAEVEKRVKAATTEIEARLSADFDKRVKDAAEAAVLAHMEAEEKAKAEAGDKPGEGGKADGKGKGGK